MEPEGAQVLVCNPTIGPVCYPMPAAGTSNVPDGDHGTPIKPKKKRSKPKIRNAIKELCVPTVNNGEDETDNLPLNSIGNVLEKTVKDVQEATDLMQNLKTASLGEAQKPKKVRKRKKPSKEMEPKAEGDYVGTANTSQADVRESIETKELKERSRKKEGKPKKTPQKNFDGLGSPAKQQQTFFFDNEKGSPVVSKKTNTKKKSEKEVFDDYLTVAEVNQGLKEETMVAGAIRINQRCYKEAYISHKGEKDIMIEGLKNRNRALEGDEVVVLINPPDAWKVQSGQRTGKVVYIREEIHSRTCIGKLPSHIDHGSTYVVFSPRDPRIPRIKIPLNDSCLPPGYLQTPGLFSETLFHVQITAWNDVSFAQGSIFAEVGESGDVEVETLAILLENNLDHRPVDPLLSIFFPRMPYTIPAEEIAKRSDLRRECIFTIDPATAKDLDDAVSAKLLDNGNVEVGVHISDVSHFLQHNTLLDQAVCKRATTIYLVQRVYHMLPVELCHLCSLTPGEDKLAFSVFLEMTSDAKVVSHRFARSVIHSCVQLSYEHAQMVIDNPEKTFTADDFPPVGNGFSAEDCAAVIRELYKLSVIMRKERFDKGALRIDQPKLCFCLDPKTQTPLSSFIYENKESHRLIEEFMLLANMTVAEQIYAAYPKLAFLRHHLPPRYNMMTELQKRLELYGVELDISDAGTVHSSMLKYGCPKSEEDVLASWARFTVLNNLCAKPMLRAEYFCPSEETPELHHYALNAPCYTHFTSPIRRYADIMVHRLLAASLDLAPPPSWNCPETKRIAAICNRQKLGAKLAGEQSGLLFLALYLTEPIESTGAVIDVKDHSFDAIVKDFGIMTRVYTDPIRGNVLFSKEDSMAKLIVQWPKGLLQEIQLFSVVRLRISRSTDSLKLTATLLPPLPDSF